MDWLTVERELLCFQESTKSPSARRLLEFVRTGKVTRGLSLSNSSACATLAAVQAEQDSRATPGIFLARQSTVGDGTIQEQVHLYTFQ